MIAEEVIVAPTPPVPAATWDGLFVGGHAGYAWTDTTVSRNTAALGPFSAGYAIDSDLDDFIGGHRSDQRVCRIFLYRL